MLFKGTANRSAEDIARSVDSIGGNLDAFTAKEMVCFNTKVLDEHLPVAIDVLSDLVLNPLFREEDIEKEKGVILEEIKMDADSPDYLVHEIFSSNFWKDHPLGKPILGTRETVKRFNQAMVQDYYRSVYTPPNLLITAAGNLPHERLVNLARERFESLAVGAAPEPPQAVPATHARICAAIQEGSGTGACLPGGAVVSDSARGPVRLLRAEHDARRRHEFAAFPEYPRAAGAGLRGVFGTESLQRHGMPVGLRGHFARIGEAGGRVGPQGVHGPEAATRARRKKSGARRIISKVR